MLKRMMLLFMLTGLVVGQSGGLFAATLYDDFSTDFIKKSIWRDHNTGSYYIHEYVREINTVDETLTLKIGTNAMKTPHRQGVSLATPFAAPLTDLRADVKIIEMNNDLPTDSATVFARIGGLFYNKDFAAPASDCFDGDIWAELAIGDRGNGLEAWFEVEEFTTCGNTVVDTLTNQSLTTGISLSLDHFYTLELSYNNDTTLTFRIYDGASLLGEISVDGPARIAPPHAETGVLQVRVHDDPGEYVDGYVHSEFDNVYVNGAASAYDTFDGPEIDPLRWYGRKYIKESINGRTRLHSEAQDADNRNRLFLRDRYTPHLSATARVESGSVMSTGAMGRVRVGGYFYNDTHGPGSYNGYEGDVWVQVALELTDSGSLVAKVVLSTSDVNQATWTNFFTQEFPTVISFDTDYVLSVNYTGTGFEFGCGSDTISYTITTPNNEPSNPMRAIGSRLFLQPGEMGVMKAQFDDVYVSDPDYTNLSGDWAGSVTGHVVTSGACTPDDDFTFNVTLTQNNTELLMYDDLGALSSYGIISGSRILTYFSELDGPELFESMADMTMSDMNNVGGTRQTRTTSDCSQDSLISLTRINEAPTADDQSISVVEDSTNNPITLTGSDPDGDPLSYLVASDPAHGTLSGTPPDLNYTPITDYFGPDSFTFTVNDGYGATDTGTVNITVNEAANLLPSADDQAVTVDEDALDHSITLTGSDPDNDPLTFAVATNPSHGTLSGAAPDMLYTPDANYNGSDSFTFTVDDGNGGVDTGTVSVTVTSVNDDPVAYSQSISVVENSADNPVACTGSDPDGDALTFAVTAGPSNGTLGGTAPDLLYTPNADYSGSDTFTFSVDDGNGGTVDIGTVSITVTATGSSGGGGGGGGGGCFIQNLSY